jgi:putative membrane protein insertion efficiency factor
MPKSWIICRTVNRVRYHAFLLLCLSGNSLSPALAELSDTTAAILSIDSTYETQKLAESAFYDQTSPVSMLFIGLINLYQRVFSAREGSATCQFRPSCSHFGAMAIKKYGVVQGTLMTGDRLLRCNQWTRGNYPLWKDNYHHFDPIEEHDLWARDSLDDTL